MYNKKVVKIVDQISIPSIILVSLPEGLIILTIGILAIGRKDYLEDRGNYIKLLLYTIISAVASYFIRRNVGSETESLIVHIILSSLLFIIVLRFRFYESIMAILFGMTLLVFTEAVSLIPIAAFTEIDISSVKNDDILRFLLTIPERIIQLVLIFIVLKFDLKIVDLGSDAIKTKEYYIQLIVYLVSVGTLIFLAAIMAKVLLLDHNNFTSPINTVLLRINIYLSLFVTIILTLAIRSTHEFYKNKNALNNNEFIQNLDYISNLIENKSYSEAKEAVGSLKSHINKS